MAIPSFRLDGYLPVGLCQATEEQVTERFGTGSDRRKVLTRRLTEWIHLARMLGVRRFLVDGSFVTSKREPHDVDCVCWLPPEFEQQYNSGSPEAMRLYEMFVSRQPEEIFGVFSEERWEEWISFFCQTREPDGRRKGLVERLL